METFGFLCRTILGNSVSVPFLRVIIQKIVRDNWAKCRNYRIHDPRNTFYDCKTHFQFEPGFKLDLVGLMLILRLKYHVSNIVPTSDLFARIEHLVLQCCILLKSVGFYQLLLNWLYNYQAIFIFIFIMFIAGINPSLDTSTCFFKYWCPTISLNTSSTH